ncbi:hypothetical protein [Glycomyces sp. NPDC047010]|uniref:hypothetical protein n=1 Tax=Glycomyces sp. NPDC047010 TaxID=3155023 RepID=UPI0033E0FB1E
MAFTGPSGATPRLSRRALLTGALLAGAVGLAPARPARAAETPQIRAAAAGWTGRGGELLVLTADALDTGYALRILEPGEAAEPGADVTGVLGPPLPLPLPDDFTPHSMAATGAVLWLTGARETAPGRVRPALLRIEDADSGYADLPVPKDIGAGLATAIAPMGEHGIAVAIEGGPDEHLTALSRSRLAVTADGGSTWAAGVLADGLGEGYGTVLAETDRGVFAAVADGDGTQTAATARLAEAGTPQLVLTPAGTYPGAGRPMAAVAADAHVSLFSDRDGAVTETRFTDDERTETAVGPAADCACRGEILAVPGRRGLWLETDGTTIHIRGIR